MFRASPSSIRPARWPGSFTNSGTNAISSRFSGVGRRRWSSEAHAVVRGHDHERTVVDAGLAESSEDDPERAVRVAGLKQVALVPLHRRPRLEPVPVVEPAEESRVDRVAPPGWEVDVRDVWKQRVREVQRRARVVVDQVGEPARVPPARLDLARRAPLHGLLGSRIAAEVAPRVVDLRQPVDVRLGQDEVEVDRADVRGERPCRVRHRLRLCFVFLAADRRGADAGQRLDRPHAVAPAEQREDAVGVLRRNGQLPGVGIEAAEHRRHRDLRQPVGRRRVAVPGRVACELGEVRKAHRVDALASVHQRRGAELVVDDQHDRGARRHGGSSPRDLLVLEDEIRDR